MDSTVFSKWIGCASVVLVAASAAAMSDAELNQAYNRIRNDKKNQPRYCQYRHDLILQDLADFTKTNALTYAQTLTWTAKTLLHANASEKTEAAREAAWQTLNGATNATVRARELVGVFDGLLHTYSFNAARGIPLAERILSENAASLGEVLGRERLLRMHGALATRALGVYRDRAQARFDAHFAAARGLAPDEKANGPSKLAFARARRGVLIGLVKALVEVDEDAGRTLFKEARGEFEDAQADEFLLKLADLATARKDRPAFDALLAQMAAYPADRRGPYREMIKKLQKFDVDTASALLEKELAAETKPEGRFALLGIRQGFNDPPIFNYGFSDPTRYATWRSALLARVALSDAHTNNPACRFFDRPQSKAWEIERMVWYDDLPNARELLSRALALWPTDRKLLQLDAQVRAITGDVKGAVSALQASLAVKGTKAEETNAVRRVVAFLEGRGIAGFDAVDAASPLTPAQRLAALRATSRTLFNCRRYADCQTIFAEIVGKVYRGEERRTYTVVYDPNAPKTADGFVRTKYYADWSKMDTGFRPYGDCYGESPAADEKWHLRGAELPKTDPAYRTGLSVLCDDEAVHVFVRCDDPKVAEVLEGKRHAAGLEMFFAPGGQDRAYHSIFFTDLPGTSDPHDSDWCAPGPHYRRNADAYTKDACLTPEGCVAHVKLPWLAFYDDLPVDGRCWNLGVIRDGAGGMQTNAGIVHELSRGLLLAFAFTPENLKALKRRVAKMAYNRYAYARKDAGGFIQRWNDPLLGDPAFYAARVAPLLEKLDAAGAELAKPDADVDALFATFVPQWAEVRYVLADLRTRYLRARLLEE